MKRVLISLIMLVLLSGISMATDRTTLIRTGGNVTRGLSFSSADSVITSATVTYNVTNIQAYQQHFTLSYTMDSISGDPSVAVTFYGKVTSTGSWTTIGTATWDDDADGTQSISSTSPANYNWLKVTFVASGATQKTLITAFEIRTANAINIPASSGTLTISRPTSGTVTVQVADDNANAAAVYRAGGTGALTLGASTGTTAITSSDWAIGATGTMTGIGNIAADGGATITGAAINLNASSNYAVNLNTGTSSGALSLGGGSGTVAVNSSTWDVTTAGVASGLTKITSTADGDNVVIDPYHDLHVVDVQVNSASVFSIDSTGLAKPKYFQFGTVVANTDASETLSAAQSGALVVCSNAAGATTITIPDASAATVGVVYYIMQTADQNLIVTATTADNNSIVCDGVATSDNVTISTAGHKIGAGMIVIGISATQWYVGGLNPESVLTPEAAD